MHRFPPLVLLTWLMFFPVWGQSQQLPSIDTVLIYPIPATTITDSMQGDLFAGHPGSVTKISAIEIQRLAPLSGNEVFRRAIGVQLVDEDALGLRINLGVRGLDPDRSRSVMIMEDGIPVSLNPYGEPEMYYTPSMDRMEGVEILKGSGQIAYGPQTVGGVVNYISASVPQSRVGKIRILGGQGGLFNAFASLGNGFKGGGYQVSILRKQASNLGPLDVALTDLQGKFQWHLSAKSNVILKTSLYQEISNATYIGITQPMFDSGLQDQVVLAPDDKLQIERAALGIIHTHQFRKNITLRTTVFGHVIRRDWRRQDFRSTPGGHMTGVIWGDTTLSGGAIYMLQGNGQRNRQYMVAGAEPVLHWNFTTGPLEHQLKTGVRIMHETAFEQRKNGSFPASVSGALVDEEIRTGRALSGFIQNQMHWGKHLSFTPGLRVEHYDFTRSIYRVSSKDTLIEAGDRVTALIPGLGISAKLSSKWVLFTGIHRGFAPPRLKDAIANNGQTFQLDAELSWNTEIGFRANPLPGLGLEFTGFFMDFSNQIIPVSESSGLAAAGLINGGASRHAGAELGIKINWHELLDWERNAFGLDAGLTYVHATIQSDRFQVLGGDTLNLRGNRTPYAPEWLLTTSLWFEADFGLGAKITANYQSSMFTDLANTVAPSANGRIGAIDGRVITDVTVYFTEKNTRLTFTLAMKNLTDERFIASRRPQGIRVGLPRYIMGGISWHF